MEFPEPRRPQTPPNHVNVTELTEALMKLYPDKDAVVNRLNQIKKEGQALELEWTILARACKLNCVPVPYEEAQEAVVPDAEASVMQP